MLKHYLVALLLAISFRPAFSAVFYVAPTGNDANSGTITSPFLTIQRGQAAVSAGDTVYVRGGTYTMQNSQIAGYLSPYAYVTLLNKSGSATAGRINYWAYPGEQPVFNYANVDPNATNAGAPFAAPYRLSAFEVTGAYIYLRGLEIVGVRVPLVASSVNTLSICFSQSGAGGNNIYERLSMHDGQAIGFYLTRGLNNLILNCDAYRNNDNVNTANTTGTAGGGNVDGFGCHPNNANYTGNVFRNCRAWQNSDDGYDCISAFAATTFENCWAFYNGYTQNFVSRGDGNGFKAGGYGTALPTALPAVIPNNTVRFCVSVRNKSNGFYSNHHQAGSFWYNNTGYQNAINYNMVNRQDKTMAGYLTDVDGYGHTLRNNISLLGRSTVTPDIANVNTTTSTLDHNTFPPNNVGITVSASDFISLDTTRLRAPRQADGSLPIIPTLRLAAGSGLIDAGTNVGFAYTGTAPDLGAFEFANSWTGTVSTDWFTSANWSGGMPTATTDALISGSAPFQPVIASGAATARTLTIGSGATLTMTGGTLDAQGDWQNGGTFTASGGTVILGTAAQTNGPNILGNRTRFWNLTVNPNGGLLSTSAGASVQRVLALNGTIATQGNPLTLESNALGTALVVNNGSSVVNGNVTVQRYLTPDLNPNLGYRHVSAPISNATIANLATAGFSPEVSQGAAYNTSLTPSTVSPFPTVYGYNQSRSATVNSSYDYFNRGWFAPTAPSDPLNAGQGYAVMIAANQTWSFTGALNNGDKTLSLARSSGATAADAGLALVGNPYPAPLDWSQVAATDRLGVDPIIFVFASNNSSNQYAGSYGFYQNGFGNISPVLPLGQGFFVRVTQGQTAGTLTLRNSQRATSYSNTTYHRSAETRPVAHMTLKAVGSPTADDAFVYFENGATDGYEGQYDGNKIENPSGLNLSIPFSATQHLCVDGRAPLGTTQLVVPLAVGVPAVGSYTLSAAELLNLSTVPTYLHDLQTGAFIDLAQQPNYPFTVSNAFALITGRFELVFSPQRVLATAPAALVQQVALYPNPATTSASLELPASLGRQAVTATLLDAMGREVQTSTLPAQGTVPHQLDLHQLTVGVYALRLSTSASVLVKKLVVE